MPYCKPSGESEEKLWGFFWLQEVVGFLDQREYDIIILFDQVRNRKVSGGLVTYIGPGPIVFFFLGA